MKRLGQLAAIASIAGAFLALAGAIYGAGGKQAHADVAGQSTQQLWIKEQEHEQRISKLEQARQDDHEMIQRTDTNVMEILRRLPK